MDSLLKVLRNNISTESERDKALDNLHALLNNNYFDCIKVERNLFEIVKDSKTKDQVIMDILSAFCDYEHELVLIDSVECVVELVKHKNSFVAVSAVQTILECMKESEYKNYILESLKTRNDICKVALSFLNAQTKKVS